MSLVDSLDSILMLYSYTGFAGHSWRIFESNSFPVRTGDRQSVNMHCEVSGTGERAVEVCGATANEAAIVPRDATETESKTVDNARRDCDSDAAGPEQKGRMTLVKRSTMSELSIVLTTMSILLAFRSVNEVTVRQPMARLIFPSISFIEIMGLIGAYCGKCEAAASAPDGGGLAGSWWRFWAQVRWGWCLLRMILKLTMQRRMQTTGTLEQG